MSHILNGRIYYINTANKVSGTTSNCLVRMEIPPNEDFDRVVVLSAVIPRSYYLIQAPNNTFILNENGIETTITIDEGNYSYLSFKTYLQNKLTSSSTQGWIYTITIPNNLTQATTGKYSFNVDNKESKTLPSFTFPDKSKVHEQMGFDKNKTYQFETNTLISPNVVKFVPEDTLYIHSDMITMNHDDVLQEVFTTGTSDFGTIRYQCTTPIEYSKSLSVAKNNVYRLTLTDEDGNTINLNGLNMVLTILLYKNDEINLLQRDYIKYQLLKSK
jgi:hypothetical protein